MDIVSKERSAKPQAFLLLQVLRGVAAMMVVAHHASILASQRLLAGPYFWSSGAAGVDLFFVISGFVMALSVERMGSGITAAWTFTKRRLERIVPLYWLATTAKILLLLLAPSLALRGMGGWYHVVSSYLFLPAHNNQGLDLPLVLVGWTLNLEMIFYLLFAIAIAIRVRLLPFLLPILGMIALVPFFHATSRIGAQIFQPIIFEFIFGIGLYQITQRGIRVPAWMACALLPLSFAVIFYTPQEFNLYSRPLIWGIPALLIVASAIGLETRLASRVPKWSLEIGDASYSIYLTHTFVLPPVGILLFHLHRTGSQNRLPAMLLCLIASLLAGELVYRMIELPIIRYFRGRRTLIPPSYA